MARVQVKNSGVLEVFGPDRKPWRVANEPFLQPAIDLAGTDADAALEMAQELVRSTGIGGIVRFRCTVAAQILA